MKVEQKDNLREFNWNFFSWSLIAIFCLLQVLRWQIMPQFMDIYYHLSCAWGFIQAGGYSGWDFWQYAPVGRTHIYPPVFQIQTTPPSSINIPFSIQNFADTNDIAISGEWRAKRAAARMFRFVCCGS